MTLMNWLKTPVELKKSSDRRSETRIDMVMACKFRDATGKIHKGLTRDLAASGVAISSSVIPEPGSTIHLVFDGHGSHAGKITRTFDDGFAVTLRQSSLAILALSSL